MFATHFACAELVHRTEIVLEEDSDRMQRAERWAAVVEAENAGLLGMTDLELT